MMRVIVYISKKGMVAGIKRGFSLRNLDCAIWGAHYLKPSKFIIMWMHHTSAHLRAVVFKSL